MARFITLTPVDISEGSRVMLVNVDHISAVTEERGITKLWMADGTGVPLRVAESFASVKFLLEE